eukprot:SAG11_NODE_1392_length_5048_cov_2.551020_4_plen_91_part_00
MERTGDTTKPSPIMFNVNDVEHHHLADGGQLVDKLPGQLTDIVLLDECIDGTIVLWRLRMSPRQTKSPAARQSLHEEKVKPTYTVLVRVL